MVMLVKSRPIYNEYFCLLEYIILEHVSLLLEHEMQCMEF